MNEYRYKIGDKVIVRNDLIKTHEPIYRMQSGPRNGAWLSCNKQYDFRGKVVTISKTSDGYKIKEDGEVMFFVDEMFLGLVSECVFEDLL